MWQSCQNCLILIKYFVWQAGIKYLDTNTQYLAVHLVLHSVFGQPGTKSKEISKYISMPAQRNATQSALMRIA